MDSLRECIKKERGIKNNSIDLYINSIKKLGGIDTLKNYDDTLKKINGYKLTTQKNKLTAIIVVLKCSKADDKLIEKYNMKLKELNEDYMKFLKNQEKTETQTNNWIEYEDLVKLSNKMMNRIKTENLKTKVNLSNKEYDMIQQILILRTYLDFPIRNNFSNMKIMSLKEYDDLDEDDKNNNNYLITDRKKRYFKINSFKNKKSIGNKSFDIQKPLNAIISLWLKFNKSGYYLTKSDRKTPMNSNGITKFLNKIFIKEYNKKISTSMLRHILISHANKDKPSIKEIEKNEQKVEDTFMHSKNVNDLYTKKD